jgi:hypothetical protein
MPRVAKPALTQANEAIALMQSILGPGYLSSATPDEALKLVRKAQYKQSKYEKAQKKDVDYRARNVGERVKKPENAWIQHVKKVQSEMGLSYKDALVVARSSYRR